MMSLPYLCNTRPVYVKADGSGDGDGDGDGNHWAEFKVIQIPS